MFRTLTEKQANKDELVKTKVIEGWITLCTNIIEDPIKYDANIRRMSVNLLSKIWLSYVEYIEKTLN